MAVSYFSSLFVRRVNDSSKAAKKEGYPFLFFLKSGQENGQNQQG